ncbi:MAG: AAA family ATPase [Candidatus Kryptoniota bacterium]
MIRKVVIRRFKRFANQEFEFPGNIVLAGPNNMGKTTLLQAISTWHLSLNQWKMLNDFQRHKGAYPYKPITRQTFSAVPLSTFELLWKERLYNGSVEIQVQSDEGWDVTMELISDTTEQVLVRPKPTADPDMLRSATLDVVFVPPMTGLSTDEPVYQPPYLEARLGMARPGEVLRNLLLTAHQSGGGWQQLQESIKDLFGYELLPPNGRGAYIIAEYRERAGGPNLDIASGGSGFQQILMLLTFLSTRPASVLLLDEPDAHLHVILQDAIFGELRRVAAEQKSQLVIATHSEKIINAVEPTLLYAMVNQPRLLATSEDQRNLIRYLGCLSNVDIMLAADAPGVLYTEDYTDLEILRAWAKVLNHPAYATLTTKLFWERTVIQPREGAEGISAKEHYEALKLVRGDLPGLELVDGDAHPEKKSTPITGHGLQRLRWTRYEIESYLIHPEALGRFIENQLGPGGFSAEAKKELREYLVKTFTPEFVDDPLGDHPLVEAYLEKRKARTEVLPPILRAGGLPGFPYTRYSEIAAVMQPDEIHPEVKEKLDLIQKAFGL